MPSTLLIGAPITGGGQVMASPAVPNGLPVQLQAQLGGCGAGTWTPVAGGLTGGGNGTYVLGGAVPALAGTFGLRAAFGGVSAGGSTWAASASTCQSVTIVAAPKLTVTALVNNSNGGTLTPNALALFVDGVPVASGVQNTSTIGGHTVSVTPVAGYSLAIAGDCAANGTITLAGNDVKACTVTASDTGLSISTTTTLNSLPNPLTVGTALSVSGQVAANPSLPNGLAVMLEAQLGGCSTGAFVALPIAGVTAGGNGSFTLAGAVPAAPGTYGIRARFAGATAGGSTWTGSASACQTVTIAEAPATRTGAIRVVLHTRGGPAAFGFTSNFGITALNTPGQTARQEVTGLTPGSAYSISETTIPDGWTLLEASCSNGTPSAVTVLPGETTTCTFINSKEHKNKGNGNGP